jgi:hypothetical protein
MRTTLAICGLSPRQEGIDTSPGGSRWRKNWTLPAIWGGVCLALIALQACRFAAANARTGGAIRPGDSLEGIASFDSFSEPSVACSILQQEAERLLLTYRDLEDSQDDSPAPPARVETTAAARPLAADASGPKTWSGPPRGAQASSLQSLRALDAEVQEVELSLSRTLLLVYAHQHLWSEFVDRYLQLVREGPARRDVMVYFRVALDAARKCGRTDEVVDVLRHVARFHPELDRAERLNGALAEWQAEISSGLQAGKR